MSIMTPKTITYIILYLQSKTIIKLKNIIMKYKKLNERWIYKFREIYGKIINLKPNNYNLSKWCIHELQSKRYYFNKGL